MALLESFRLSDRVAVLHGQSRARAHNEKRTLSYLVIASGVHILVCVDNGQR
jgi:hypothetical protein